MTQQHNEAFEKWFASYCKSNNLDESDYETNSFVIGKANTKFGWEAAKADSEREIAIALEQLDRLITRNDELQAQNNVLREALDAIRSEELYPSLHKIIADKALASTPAQSLQTHDDEVIERCAKIFDGAVFSYDYREIAEAIRALKGKS